MFLSDCSTYGVPCDWIVGQFSVHSLLLYVLQFHNSKISLRLEMNLELNIGPLKANTGYQIDISYI